MARHLSSRRRRGVVLLVILSLLVLFALLGVTFAIVAGQYRKSAATFSRRDQYGDDPARQLDSAFYVLLRDTPNSRNPLRGHALLSDIYGFNYTTGSLTSGITPIAGGQFLQFNANTTLPTTAAGFFNGNVLTFTSGKLRGVSTRIVGYNPSSGTFRVLRPKMDDASLEQATPTYAVAGDRILINGRAFSGTGAGYDPTTGKLNKTGTATVPGLAALQPNRSGEMNNDFGANYAAGGVNESHDAADLDNMFLAAVILDPADPNGYGVKIVGNRAQIIPSFHRPALIRYAQANGIPIARTTMRPVPAAQGGIAGPDFPIIDLVNGPWDVDNDGDGIPDSVWTDLDFPMLTSPAGRVYKPLFAIHCVDMDGRMNLNFQGNFQQITSLATPMSDRQMAGGTMTSGTTSRGAGLGPGEVNLKLGLGLTDVELQQLLEGYNNNRGRYGSIVSGQTVPTPGGAGDLLDQTKFFEIPFDFFRFYNANGAHSSYASPPDLQGQLAYGVDQRGQLITSIPIDTPTPGGDRRFNSIYRTRQPYDDRFTPAELERILRYYDIDAAALPRRLEHLTTIFNAGGGSQTAANRRNVTIESRDIPVATAGPVYTPPGMGGTPQRIPDPLQMLRARMSSVAEADLVKLVDPMLYHGIKMDLNRPLGDGIDNNGNGVVDEMDQNELQAQVTASGFNLVNGFEKLDADANTLSPAEQALARYQLAKHLYILASLVSNTGATPNPQTQLSLAQWAINVVDFRDADSIMTPFEFDINPFDGWSVDGQLTTNGTGAYPEIIYDSNGSPVNGVTSQRFVVWGCERPELLLSETLNLHDRRTTDTNDEMTVVDDTTGAPSMPAKMKGKLMEAMAANNDERFDQQYLPQGSTFIEIYNPWTSMVQRPPAEFYGASQFKTNAGANQWQWTSAASPDTCGVKLNQVTPAAGSVQGSPVWRILVVKDAGKLADPDEPDPTSTNLLQAADIERSIYFVDIAGKHLDAAHQGTPYYSDLPVAPIKPGRYAVIGSGAPQAINNEYATVIGYNNTLPFTDANYVADALPATRQLVLTPNVDPDQNQFLVRNNASTVRPEPLPLSGAAGAAQVQPVVAVVVNKTTGGTARRLSISEPVDGYDSLVTAAGGTVTMSTNGLPDTITDSAGQPLVLDVPLDFTDGEGKDVLMKDGTKYQHRVMHLQRLANPLLPFDANTNPYRTIDSIGADLTCFNGVTADKENDPEENDEEEGIETLQRGDYPQGAAPPPRVLWKRTMQQKFIEAPEADTTHYFGWQLHHTLGYLNSSYATAPSLADMQTTDDPAGNYLKGDLNTLTNTQTFPLLMWNNRPYNSVYELMNVPRVHSSVLTREFSVRQANVSPYQDIPQNQPQMGYGHLMNFFYTPTAVPPGQAAELYRIFDYLRVPSLFVESDSYFTFTNAATPVVGTEGFLPPFHRYSNFRDPGLINVNTIYSEQTWNAVLNGASGPTFNKLIASRRGYGGASADMLYNDPAYPTEFANPVRGSGFGKLAPLANMERNDVECTLLRSDDGTNDPPAAPLPSNQPPNGQPLFGNAEGAPYNDVNRHGVSRYATLGRLANTLTTRSNVYAVWITVGYFEVDTNGLLGQELGADTGEIRRHRAFYMVDRSIPVGFEPGENHNVDRAVLLRRFIE